MKTVAKDMYGELDLIDAPTNLSYDTILDKLLALLLYLRARRAFERKRQELLKAQREYELEKPNKTRKISQDMDALNKELDSLKNCNDQQ